MNWRVNAQRRALLFAVDRAPGGLSFLDARCLAGLSCHAFVRTKDELIGAGLVSAPEWARLEITDYGKSVAGSLRKRLQGQGQER